MKILFFWPQKLQSFKDLFSLVLDKISNLRTTTSLIKQSFKVLDLSVACVDKIPLRDNFAEDT